MNQKKLMASLVHLYTSTGLVFALIAALAIKAHHIELFMTTLWLAVIVDSTDGFLARRFDVKKVLPSFSGRRLDDITDYITYVFLPVLGIIEFQVLPGHLWWVAPLPLLASAYGFCQDVAKTEESFVGFPSYWNVLFIYLYLLQVPVAWSVTLIVFCSIMVFVPIRYIYPSRTRWLQRPTLALSSIYGMLIMGICLFARQDWIRPAVWISLFYPAYYLAVSLLHHQRVMAKGGKAPEALIDSKSDNAFSE